MTPPAERSTAIDTVHVIFKTHLDIGFTDFSANVVKTYFQSFIPKALETAETLARAGGDAQFVWTVGSWLVYEYLEQASREERKRMEKAIAAGQISWLGLPFTMHTELLDRSLFEFALSLAGELDARFGKKTIAAKMTDVPGHTIAMVPPMAAAGIQFLHIGVNAASAVPKTPPLFDWRLPAWPKKDTLRVMVHATYGGATVLPGFKHALYFAHTNDNHGPQPVAEIQALFTRLQAEYPGAKVIASNLNAYAAQLMKYKQVPLHTKEIGDNWIRGVGTDPQKVAQLRSLLHLRRTWLANDATAENNHALLKKPLLKPLHAFSRNLLLVTEHTWGLDEKTHLNDFKNYRAADFARLRKTAPARKMEKSWDEQRGYLRAALQALGKTPRAAEARAALATLTPRRPNLADFRRYDLAKPLTNGRLSLTINPDTGAIGRLARLDRSASPRLWADAKHALGTLSYVAYAQADYDRYYRQYARDTHLHGAWILPDITKPGMPKTIRHTEWTARPVGAWQRESASHDGRRREQQLLVQLRFPEVCSRAFGAPRTVYLLYSLVDGAPQVGLQLTWFDKPACRLPEAFWLGFQPRTAAAAQWRFRKLGVEVNPADVTEHGGRQLHAVDLGVTCRDGRDTLQLLTPDAPLIAPGREDLIDFSTRQPDLRQGIRVSLYNNTWGTNFPMWSDDDAKFRFVLGLV